ncbi:MAG TPA: HDOD domain-containing protein, partial [Pirellulaceae bacterium]|nr:HDOD domain-containing protein [Pirellulaceae bacterium]
PEAKKNPGHVAVGLSSLLPPVNDNDWPEREKFLAVYQQVAPPGSPTIEEFLAKIDVEFAEFAPVLKLAVPKRSLVESVAGEPAKA